MSVKTFPTVLDFLIKYRRFHNNIKNSIISVLKIFTELRVSGILVFVKSTFLKNGIPFMAQGSTIQRKADKV